MSGERSDSLDAYWRELVTTSMLGTDRREPPPPPPGPVADLVADAQRPDGASRMLASVAAVAAARRAAFVPGPPAAGLQPPAADERSGEGRPWCSPSAVATWREIVSNWQVLEDEWMLTLVERGLSLPPDALVDALARHRGDPVRRARAMLAAGRVGPWLVDHLPALAASSTRSVPAEAVASLPDLPMSPELAELAVRDAHTVAAVLAGGFDEGRFGPPDRPVLVNLVARCRPAVLLEVADGLARTGIGHALALADLARLRHRMLVELGVSP